MTEDAICATAHAPFAAGNERAVAHVNLAAISRNIKRAQKSLADGVAICAVVKGDAYGHGAAPVAATAVTAGATRLAVSTAREAADLRRAGITEPILVMGPLSATELQLAVHCGAEVVAWTDAFVDQLASSGALTVHLHIDVGMGTLGLRDVDQALGLAQRIRATSGLSLAGVMTQLPTANDPGDPSFDDGLRSFARVVDALRGVQPGLIAHAGNSPALLRSSSAQFDMVRLGDILYGFDPFGLDPALRGLEPALSLSSYVASTRALQPGAAAGYGGRFVASRATRIGVVPFGYGDGFRRSTRGGWVLIGGKRFGVVGTVAMDSVIVDLDGDASVAVGDRVVLIGSQGDQRITAEELARAMDAVNAELTCGLTQRVPRVYHRDGERAA